MILYPRSSQYFLLASSMRLYTGETVFVLGFCYLNCCLQLFVLGLNKIENFIGCYNVRLSTQIFILFSYCVYSLFLKYSYSF